MGIFFCQGHGGTTNVHECGNRVERWSGKVLDTFEDNGYHDSYWYALVWDDELGEPRKVEWGSTASWSYHNSVTVDATPEVLERALAWYRKGWTERAIAATHEDVNKPRHGAEVRSTTTRGPNVGITGEVRWTGEGRYGPRVGIKVEGRKSLVFMAADRVAVVNPAPVDEQEIRDHAANVDPGWKCMRTVGAA